jgi:hypothetical protein
MARITQTITKFIHEDKRNVKNVSIIIGISVGVAIVITMILIFAIKKHRLGPRNDQGFRNVNLSREEIIPIEKY